MQSREDRTWLFDNLRQLMQAKHPHGRWSRRMKAGSRLQVPCKRQMKSIGWFLEIPWTSFHCGAAKANLLPCDVWEGFCWFILVCVAVPRQGFFQLFFHCVRRRLPAVLCQRSHLLLKCLTSLVQYLVYSRRHFPEVLALLPPCHLSHLIWESLLWSVKMWFVISSYVNPPLFKGLLNCLSVCVIHWSHRRILQLLFWIFLPCSFRALYHGHSLCSG